MMLTGPQVADMLGIKPGSWRAMVSDGRAPRADDIGADGYGRWDRSRIQAWDAGRPRVSSGYTREARLRALVRRATGGELG